MSEMPQHNTDNQVIDLTQVSKRIGLFFDSISTSIFKGILFLKRNLIILAVLFIVGAGLGFYLDSNNKVYDNQIIVEPNFGSVDYLYAKIELINAKIKENDTVFLKDVVGIKNTKKFREIQIKPIADVYKFVENRPTNFELIKLMAEDGDIKSVLSDDITSKNYPLHLITFRTVGKTDYEKTINPLLAYLNASDYYTAMQKEYFNNVKVKLVENDSIINQINGLLNSFAKTVNSSQKSDKLVYYNENSQLNDVIKTKDLLVSEQGYHRIELQKLDKIVKNNSEVINIRNTESLNGKLKFTIPLLLIMFFILGGIFKSYYKRQMLKLNN